MRVGLQEGLGRGPYLAAGIALFVVKIGLDFLVAHAFSKPYSILFYVSPVDAPLLRPAEGLTYWLTMWAVALPFIATGLVLTIRRLRDAGLSPWLGLLFFAPFANMLFFVFCTLVPRAGQHPNVVDAEVRNVHNLSYSRAAVSAGLIGAVVGLGAFGVAVFLLGSYGASLFIGAPPIGGLIAGLLFARWHRPRFAGSILSGVLSVVIAGMLVIAFALEGLICLAMAFPLVLVGSIIGAGIGYLSERTSKGNGFTPTATALLFFPLTLVAEGLNPLPVPDALPVETSIVIDAPVERVWRRSCA